jgi:cutinase
MKSFIPIIVSLTSAALASPVSVVQEKRQYTGLTENEFTLGGCRDVIFIWARGSTESGNMVSRIMWPISYSMMTINMSLREALLEYHSPMV